MLKALELSGFKSFADKTRFEFPPGITVVVGPNGSGKSNIVDAVKWVLGEQSAKSLRGKDMADVIFKGAGQGSRRTVNTAEATIIFDNTEGRLPVEAPEVHVTRRVYRSGEGEYLINRQPCRLKDIKDLFRGTGVGTDAYSLIEQGKVDRMLQASPKDRRAIFEEAAGISRFKAKKVEAQRRLERVEQNLLRLSDIVDEVENRLRSVRSQASKARRYRQYSQRLQQLRTQVGLADWHRLSERIEQSDRERSELRGRSQETAAQAEACEARSLEMDVEIASAVEAIRSCENRIARNREQIAGRQSSVQQGYSRCRELEEAQRRHRRQLAAMTGRVGNLQGKLRDTTAGLQQAERLHHELRRRLQDHEDSLRESTEQLEQLGGENQSRREDHAEQLERIAELSNQIIALESKLSSLQSDEQRALHRIAALEAEAADYGQQLEQAQQQEQQLEQQVKLQRQRLARVQEHLRDTEQRLGDGRDLLAEAQQKFSAASERARVLEELEENQEGLSAGVREILELAQQSDEGPFAEVQGLVADLLQVRFDIAPVVDVALGETAQYVALSGSQLLEEIQSGRFRPSHRLGLVRIDDQPPGPRPLELEDRGGVIGRLDKLVSCDTRVAPLVERLLSDTWLVESLAIAMALRATAGDAARFVTVSGELVERSGAVLLGSRSAATTLVSRRSELRQLRETAEEHQQQITTEQQQLRQLQAARLQHSRAVRQLDEELTPMTGALAEQRANARALRQRQQQLDKEQASAREELALARQHQQAATHELDSARDDLSQRRQRVATLETEIGEAEQTLEQLEARRQQDDQRANTAKVELARSEQQLETLRLQRKQFEEDQRERSRAISESRGQLRHCQDRLREANREILRATSELAELYLDRETLDRQTTDQLKSREALSAQKARLADQNQQLRRQAQELDEKQHQLELDAGQLHHQRKTLADRLREDYAIEIAELEDETTPQERQQRDEVEQEIADLRRKVNNIGAVNMDALEELEELENRFASLSGQFQDLREAKEALERIIQRINADSRRLFQETLETIRANFQLLYRKAFGGGRADLVLEEGVDLLEAGIDIIATPPGKPSFNNSLLSGGEKALTAVSLLLAIFQYRPSPFCVLDEVDAPFDEANIGRFIDVLRGFLGWTKFVIVTHSKKTMASATTLYGVTMQESGVSKQVSVRFDDVSEDGHISQEAIEREQSRRKEDERGAA